MTFRALAVAVSIGLGVASAHADVPALPTLSQLEQAARARVGTTPRVSLAGPVARPDDPGKHDPLRLAAAYRDIIG